MSESIRRSITYFSRPGAENTEEVARLAAERAGEGDIQAIAVATTSGRSALTVARATAGKAGTPVFAVNFQAPQWQKHSPPDPEIRAQAEALGVRFMPEAPVVRYLKEIPGHSPDSLRRLGQGVKVAVEAVMQAVEAGRIDAGAKVIGIGGTSRGCDVALVVKAAGPDALNSLWVGEILAKPL
jgi:hypothetical protein